MNTQSPSRRSSTSKSPAAQRHSSPISTSDIPPQEADFPIFLDVAISPNTPALIGVHWGNSASIPAWGFRVMYMRADGAAGTWIPGEGARGAHLATQIPTQTRGMHVWRGGGHSACIRPSQLHAAARTRMGHRAPAPCYMQHFGLAIM